MLPGRLAANGSALKKVCGLINKYFLQIRQENLKSSAEDWLLGAVGCPTGQWSQTHIRAGKWMADSGWNCSSEWPSQSPDLNPFENKWTVLKKQVCARSRCTFFTTAVVLLLYLFRAAAFHWLSQINVGIGTEIHCHENVIMNSKMSLWWPTWKGAWNESVIYRFLLGNNI